MKLASEKIGGFITEKLVMALLFFTAQHGWHALGYGWPVGWTFTKWIKQDRNSRLGLTYSTLQNLSPVKVSLGTVKAKSV